MLADSCTRLLCGRAGAAVMLVALWLWAAGCVAVSPAPRLDQYLGAAAQARPGPDQVRPPQGTRLDVGLVIVHDAAGNRADPAVLRQSKSFLTDQTRQRAESRLPVRIAAVLETKAMDPGQALQAWRAQATGQRLDYVLVALFSNDQTDSPDSLSLDGTEQGGGAMGRVLGITTRNHALAELALLSMAGRDAAVLARADGRAWGTLERLANGIESNAYPAIRLSGRLARITPPGDEASAKDVLRGLAGLEALEQAMGQLAEAWKSAGQR